MSESFPLRVVPVLARDAPFDDVDIIFIYRSIGSIRFKHNAVKCQILIKNVIGSQDFQGFQAGIHIFSYPKICRLPHSHFKLTTQNPFEKMAFASFVFCLVYKCQASKVASV